MGGSAGGNPAAAAPKVDAESGAPSSGGGALKVEATVNSVVVQWSVGADASAPVAASDALGADDGGRTGSLLVRLRPTGASGGRRMLLRKIAGAEAEECRVAVVREAGSSGAGDEHEEQRLASSSSAVPSASSTSGVVHFHFLAPRRKFIVTLEEASPVGSGSVADAPEAGAVLARQEIETLSNGRDLPTMLAQAIGEEQWRTFVGPEHDLGEWLAECPEDVVWAWQPEFPMLRALWLNACFTLPSPRSPITTCPNPIRRYCLDLAKSGHWLRGKKVRRHKGDFTLTVNKDFRDSFLRCRDLHKSRGDGCWITEELVAGLDRCRREGGELKVYSVELWDKKTGKLAAAIMSLSVGDIFHDYTTATLLRDDRSPGAILSKVLGHLLVECGYSLWYWGFKNPYMAEYDSNYGGVTLDNRREFWPRWKAARAKTAGVFDLATRVPPGIELDLATL